MGSKGPVRIPKFIAVRLLCAAFCAGCTDDVDDPGVDGSAADGSMDGSLAMDAGAMDARSVDSGDRDAREELPELDGGFACTPGFALRAVVPDARNSVSACDLATADFDHDGDMDFVAVDYDRSPIVFMNDGMGVFEAVGVPTPPGAQDGVYQIRGLVIADFDGDGSSDFATHGFSQCHMPSGCYSGIVEVSLNDGTGRSWVSSSYTLVATPAYDPGPASSLGAGDLDDDGSTDLVLLGTDLEQTQALINDGHGTFAPQDMASGPPGARGVAVVDTNGDGSHEVVVASDGMFEIMELLDGGVNRSHPAALSILKLGAGGTLDVKSVYPLAAAPIALRAADLNDDGQVDFAIADSTVAALQVVLGHADGTLSTATTYALPAVAQTLVVAELDGRDALDIGLLSANGFGVSVAAGQGRGVFVASTPFTVPDGTTRSLAAADFDGDSLVDLVIGGYSGATRTLSLLSNRTECTP